MFSSKIRKVLPGEDQPLLIRGNSLHVLDLAPLDFSLDLLDVGGVNLKSDGPWVWWWLRTGQGC